VIGLGSQDSRTDAEAFVDRYDLDAVRMLWDASDRSWRALGIRGQPAAVLLAADGSELGRWFGPFDEDEVVRRARAG